VRKLAEAVSIALTAAAVGKGFGKPAAFLSPEANEVIGATTFSVFVIGLWASSFARVSMAYLLLQVTQSTAWRVALWVIIGFQLGSLGICNILELWQCRPIRANWAPVSAAQCMSQAQIWSIGYTWTGACCPLRQLRFPC